MRILAAVLVILSGCAAPVPSSSDVWTLTPLHTGVCRLGLDHVLGGSHTADERMEFVIYAYLAEGPRGEVVLIDLGPKSLEHTNAMFRRHGFFRDLPGRPDDVVQPHGNVFTHLQRRGIARERVSRIVFTHFHADHHGMDDATNGGAAEDFPNAAMNVSRAGWEWNVVRRKDGQWNSYLDWAFGDFLLKKQEEGRLEQIDDGTVVPGLEIRYLGGHSPCSRAVMVNTASGWAVITSDDVYRYDLLEEGVMARLHVTPEKLIEATDRLVALARDEGGILVPLHDPLVGKSWEEKGDGWLAALKPVSDRAIAGYLSRRSTLKKLLPGNSR